MRYLPFLVAAAGLALAGCAPSSHQPENAASGGKKARLELSSYVSSSTNILGEQVKHIVSEIDRASGGNIEIKLFEPGMLVGSMELIDAVSDGKVDMGYGTAGFWMGKIPAAALFTSVPFGPDSAEFVAWLYHGNGMKLYQEMYDTHGFDVKVLVCSMIPPETSGWFVRPIEKVEDLKGLNMRFFGLGGMVMSRLGVSVSVLPPGEIFPALEKGVLDATEFATPTIDESLGFYKLAKYNYFPGWHQQSTAFELTINKKVWASLSPSQQAIIENVCQAGVTHSIAYGEATQAAALLRNERDRNVKNMTWSPEMLATFRKEWEIVAAELSAKDPFFKKAFADLQAFRKEYAVWGTKAYVR